MERRESLGTRLVNFSLSPSAKDLGGITGVEGTALINWVRMVS